MPCEQSFSGTTSGLEGTPKDLEDGIRLGVGKGEGWHSRRSNRLSRQGGVGGRLLEWEVGVGKAK